MRLKTSGVLSFPRGLAGLNPLNEELWSRARGLVDSLPHLKRLTPNRRYIPSLRTPHGLHQVGLQRDPNGPSDPIARVLGPRFGDRIKNIIFTGHTLYDDFMEAQCSPKATRDRLASFNRYFGSALFSDEKAELVAQRGYGSISLFAAGRPERSLELLGDGVSAMLTILYTLFMQSETWHFIEEPEIFLHPGYERILFDLMCRSVDEAHDAKPGPIFMSTHSNHLLGLALRRPDIVTIFSLDRSAHERDQFCIRASNGRDISVLNALGVEHTSIFIANCVVWVEGPTDVTWVRVFLNAYCRLHNFPSPREDLDFAFSMYGGSLIANYKASSELSADGLLLNPIACFGRMFVLADRDSDKDSKHTTWAELANQFKQLTYMVTWGREIENYISPTLVATVLDRLAIRHAEVGDVPQDERLGDWLMNLTDNARRFAENGVMTDYWKKKLADISCEVIATSSVEQLSDLCGAHALSLGAMVYKFIKSHSPSMR